MSTTLVYSEYECQTFSPPLQTLHLHADHLYLQTVRFTLTFASIRKQKRSIILSGLSTGADISGVKARLNDI